jgi:hypothetical protein
MRLSRRIFAWRVGRFFACRAADMGESSAVGSDCRIDRAQRDCRPAIVQTLIRRRRRSHAIGGFDLHNFEL